jgi:RimJ/RimL family protein N-acetyltransferase
MLVGKLVTLRALTEADYPQLNEYRNDVELEVLSGGPLRPTSLASTTEFFDNLAKDKESLSFAIEADGNFIGDCGLFHVDRRNGTAELGIGIGNHDYWGKGYGREAMRLLLGYGFTIQNLRKVWLETLAYNERAIRSYRAIGFVEEGRQREQVWSNGSYVDLVLMGLFRSDYVPET